MLIFPGVSDDLIANFLPSNDAHAKGTPFWPHLGKLTEYRSPLRTNGQTCLSSDVFHTVKALLRRLRAEATEEGGEKTTSSGEMWRLTFMGRDVASDFHGNKNEQQLSDSPA